MPVNNRVSSYRLAAMSRCEGFANPREPNLDNKNDHGPRRLPLAHDHQDYLVCTPLVNTDPVDESDLL